MERTQLFDLMGELKLFGMRSAYDEVMSTGIKRQHEPPRIVGDLLQAEIAEKHARSIKYQMTIAKLPLAKDIDDFAFESTPINERLVRDLAAGGFLDDSTDRRTDRSSHRYRQKNALRANAAGEIAHQPFIDRRAFEGEVVDVLSLRKFGDRHLIFDRARMFFRDFRLEQIADNARRLMLPLDAGRHHLIIGQPIRKVLLLNSSSTLLWDHQIPA